MQKPSHGQMYRRRTFWNARLGTRRKWRWRCWNARHQLCKSLVLVAWICLDWIDILFSIFFCDFKIQYDVTAQFVYISHTSYTLIWMWLFLCESKQNSPSYVWCTGDVPVMYWQCTGKVQIFVFASLLVGFTWDWYYWIQNFIFFNMKQWLHNYGTMSFRMNLDCVNVASIGWAIQVRVFETWGKGRDTANHWVVSLPVGHSWSSWFHWKAMSYAFQDWFGLCECGQYWLSNSSAGFWGMMQRERYS